MSVKAAANFTRFDVCCVVGGDDGGGAVVV